MAKSYLIDFEISGITQEFFNSYFTRVRPMLKIGDFHMDTWYFRDVQDEIFAANTLFGTASIQWEYDVS